MFYSAETTKSMALASREFWESLWSTECPQKGWKYYEYIARHLPVKAGLSFCEIGCAPGGILAEFCARLGYEAHGIDYAVNPESIKEYLRSENIKLGHIHQGDFLSWAPNRQYDIVASFGFVEHFENARSVVDRHFELVRPGGLVVITMPNFARGQKVLNWLFNRELLRIHNTKCMNLAFLRAAARRNDAEIIDIRYAGGHFDFFCVEQKRSWLTEHYMWRLINLLRHISSLMPEGVNPVFSPYLIAVYRAKGHSS